MADPVKISELPIAGTVEGGDILPVVDSGLTQTRRCTAAQIAAIGGGPPGDGTVTEGKIANGAVTYPKIQNVTGDRVLGRTSGSSGVVQEIPCTTFARSLLAAVDGNAARNLINDTPTFTGTVTVNGAMNVSGAITASGGFAGQVQAGDGTENAPSYSFLGDTNTGIARLGGSDTLSLVTNGSERLRVLPSGNLAFRTPSAAVTQAEFPSGMFPGFMVRAWANAVAMPPPWMRANGGFTSIVRYAQGHYGMNLSFAMPDSNYAVVCGAMRSDITYDVFIAGAHSLNPNGFQVHISDNQNDGDWDVTHLTIVVLR